MYRLFLALRYLRSRLVNLIAIGGVMAGVAVLIVVTSVMDGFRVRVLESVRGNLSDLTLVSTLPGDQPQPPFASIQEKILRDPRVEAVSPVLHQLGFYLYQGGTRDQLLRAGTTSAQQVDVVGIDWDREIHTSQIASYMKVALDDHDPLKMSARALDYERPGMVLVSRTFAKRFLGLGIAKTARQLLDTDVLISFIHVEGDPASGMDNVRTRYEDYQFPIGGVYDAGDTSMDAARVFMDREALRRMMKSPDEYGEIRVKLNDYGDASAVQADLVRDLPGFQVYTWEQMRAEFLRAVNNEKVLLAIVLSFIVLLGGFIILATLTLTVVEKTRDIGVLSALGAGRGGVLSIFLGNGLAIGVIGALLGLGLGALFTENVNWVKQTLESNFGIQLFPPNIYLFSEIPTVWDWKGVFVIMGGSVLVAFFAGLIPALRAARMDPIKALRYE